MQKNVNRIKLVLHRWRDLLMRQSTMILNTIGAHLAEFLNFTAHLTKVAKLVVR